MDGPLKIPLMRMSLMNELLAICYSILKEELHAEQEFIFLFFIFFFLVGDFFTVIPLVIHTCICTYDTRRYLHQ